MIRPPASRSNKSLAFSATYFLIAALVLGLVAARPVSAKDPSTLPALKRVEAKSQAVAAKVLPATVGIINQSLAGGGRMGEGSGVCVSEDGLILTAGHVMGAAGDELTIIFPDGRRATAKALGDNFTRDSGMAKIVDKGKYPHVEMGHSDDLKPGAWCMALGHPGGVQKGRTPPIRLGRILVAGKHARFIVSDATVISGDSGGPLFDLEGRVIGIHSNIGMSVNQNQHVPIDVFRGQWDDLLASKTFGSPRDMLPAGGINPDKLQKFQQLFMKRMMAGDPEVKGLVKDGRLSVGPEDIDRLIAKWEKAEAESKAASATNKSATNKAAGKTASKTAGATESKTVAATESKTAGTESSAAAAANEPLDFLKFQQLLQDRLLSGNPETLKLIKGGKMMLTPAQMRQLTEQWEGKSLAAAANEPLDFLKFQRLFQDRLLSGDAETLKLINGGKMMLTPAQARQLMEQWEGKSLAAEGSKAKPGDAAKASEAAKSTETAKPTEAAKSSDTSKPGDTPKPSQSANSDKAAKPADKSDKSGSGKVAEPSRPAPRFRPPEQPVPEKAKVEDLAKMRELLKNAEPLGDGRFRFRGSRDAAATLRSLPGGYAASRALSYGKSSPQLLQDLASIAAAAGKSTVVVLCDGKPAALGTVVRKDGYIVTKSSELHGKFTCKIGSRQLPATFVKMRSEHDLTLLKVDAADLVPITWADGDSPPPGSWLVTPGADNDALGLGVVSIAARQIPKFPTMLLRNRAIVGVMLDQEAKNALVQDVRPRLPAARAGMKPGDIIEKIDGHAIKGPKEVNQFLGRYNPGDKISVLVTRAGKPVTLKVELASSDEMAPVSAGDHLTRLSEAGGTVSKRHGDFIRAFTHDTVLQSTDCGGPVVNLDGRAVGLNIARADRTATYAIPASMARAVIAEMLPK